MVNKQHTDKPHGYDVPDAWPFPVFPTKPWTPEQVEEYNKQQRDKTPEAPF